MTAGGVTAGGGSLGSVMYGGANVRMTGLTWLLVLALTLAPAFTVPTARAAEPAPEAPVTLDLSARWPVLLDASSRTLAPAGGERALPRAQRRPATPRRRPCPRFVPAAAALPRAPRLPELGRRQDDGG